jgi:putative hemolysin
MTTIIYLVVLALCAIGSGFFSGSETALMALGRERVHQIDQYGKRGHRVAQLANDPDRTLSTLLVANNLVNILGASVATTLFIGLLGQDWGPWVATGVVTAVVLVVGEITPKSLAARYPEKFSLAVAPTIVRLSVVLNPVSRLFRGVTRGLFRLLRIDADPSSAAVTEEDIRALAALSHAGGVIEKMEREIIEALFTLADRPVRDVMTPRVDIVMLTEPIDLTGVRAAVAAAGHSRYPVTAGNVDELLGILYVKDILQLPSNPTPEDITRLYRTPRFVPESTPILSVLQTLRKDKHAFAVVVDEHGGIEGIVTIKDLVAELVGELQDEYDPGAPTAVRMGTGEWLADGRLPLEDLEAAIGVSLPPGPYATAGGLIMALAGRIPEEGDTVDAGEVRMTVLQMDRHRVDRLRVDRT